MLKTDPKLTHYQMVAEALPETSGRKRAKHTRVRAFQIPLYTRLKARNLYVGQMLGAAEVGNATGLTAKQIYDLADREGWGKARIALRTKAADSAETRAQQDIDALVQEVAADTAELSLGTLAKAKITLERDDKEAARDLQAYSQAAKNFVGLYRQAKSLDVAAQQGSTTNVMFISCARAGDAVPAIAPAKADPINVTPIAAPVTQVASEA